MQTHLLMVADQYQAYILVLAEHDKPFRQQRKQGNIPPPW